MIQGLPRKEGSDALQVLEPSLPPRHGIDLETRIDDLQSTLDELVKGNAASPQGVSQHSGRGSQGWPISFAAPSAEKLMPIITPDQQRDFEAARRKLEAVCLLWDAPWYVNTRETVEPEDCERVRWLLVRMGLARGTPGGSAVADLARRGYAISALIPWTARVGRLAGRVPGRGVAGGGQRELRRRPG